MDWIEELPNNCPPSDAKPPDGQTFYRLCQNNPPEGSDFVSLKIENPSRTFAGVSECQLRAVSIWSDVDKCASLKKFKTLRDRVIGSITLSNEDGLIKQTNGPHHYSWWRSTHFNPNIAVIVEQ
ncbi:MAG: hypothetical protein ABJH05_00525 [Fulvivirga sp.]